MDYSEIYFGKQLKDVAITDINHFFAEPRTESETVEFKSYGQGSFDEQFTKAVLRTISAFLNSSGGLLIWGAPRASKDPLTGDEIFAGELFPVPEFKSKDSLINRMGTGISPAPIGIEVQIIPVGNAFVYLFVVTASIRKPHQSNNAYLIRLDGQTKPAPHYVVEALFNQVTYPDLNGYIKFEQISRIINGFNLRIRVYICNFSEFQNDEKISYQLNVQPGRFEDTDSDIFESDVYDVIHFGKPITAAVNVHIKDEDLTERPSVITLALSFGGRRSPAKLSMYTLEGNRMPPENHRNANSLIIQMEENLLFSEHHCRLDKGKDAFLRDILER